MAYLSQAHPVWLANSYEILKSWKSPGDVAIMTSICQLLCVGVNSFIEHSQIVAENMEEVLVLEDDVDFEPNFRAKLDKVLEEAHRLEPEWDLM